ncbi:hypothetical protein RJT34_13907 [Clitoria ternatea]|uniref:Uncharacterized protein n=1 Tax=Clitoria ternatea TaxID=43366 RepID=A0AAN9JPT6_CLITE
MTYPRSKDEHVVLLLRAHVGVGAVTARAVGGRHKGAIENIEFLGLVIAKEDWKGGDAQRGAAAFIMVNRIGSSLKSKLPSESAAHVEENVRFGQNDIYVIRFVVIGHHNAISLLTGANI